MFELGFAKEWDCCFKKFDKSIQEQIWAKITSLKVLERARHLKHGLPFFVLEAGQFRICFEQEKNSRTIMFAGTHKQYEKWVKKQ